MKKLLFVALAALSLDVSAQPFNLVTGTCGLAYGRPCTTLANGYSYSDIGSGTYYLPSGDVTDVHGSLSGSNVHYMLGHYDNSGDMDLFYMKKDMVNGTILDFLSIDANTQALSQMGLKDDAGMKMTIDESNQLAYLTGSYSSGGGSTSYLICLNNINTSASIAWAITLNDEVLDVSLDGNGNVVVLEQVGYGGGCYFVLEEFDNTGSYQTSFSGVSYVSAQQIARRMVYDNSTGNFYVCGYDNGAGFVFGVDNSLSYINHGLDYTFSGYAAIDMDPTNNEVVVVGTSVSGSAWASWDVSGMSYYVAYSGQSTTSADNMIDLLVDPNGQYIVIAIKVVSSVPERYLTYVDKAANGGLGDVHYGGSSYHFVNNPSGILATCLHKDDDGHVVVGGIDVGNDAVWTARFTDGALSSWTNYKNKTTGIRAISSNDDIVLSPNPVKNELAIQATIKNISEYRIMNTMGQIVSSGTLSGDKTNSILDMSKLAKGNYYLQLQSAKGQQVCIKQFSKE
jgi:hypothetical protein